MTTRGDPRVLVVFYSRSGHTRSLAESVATELGADLEEIRETRSRSGFIGWMMAGRDASNRHATPIEILQHDPAAYDMVVVGTPVWVQSVSCGIRTYLQHAGPTFQGVALFTTSGWGRRPDEAVQETTELCQREPVAVLSLSSRAVKRNRHSDRLKRFVAEVRRATNVSQANSSS